MSASAAHQPHPAGRAALDPAPAVRTAWELAHAARDRDPAPFERVLDRSDRAGLHLLLLTMAAAMDPGADPLDVLEWVGRDVDDWSPATVEREAARWQAGDTDRTAREAERRRLIEQAAGY